jgi:hypothetical protein
MDKLSPPATDEQIFNQFSLMNPNLYYNPFINQNLLLTEESPSYSHKINNSKILKNPQISKNKTKKNTCIEISLITLLNAISEANSKNSNTKKLTPQKDNSNKNESFSSESEKQGDSYTMMELLTQKTKRNQKYCNACPHHNAPHYAKGMCSNCYHSRGRKKKPWNCPHTNKFHYALGLCQNCYQMSYMKKQNDDGGKIGYPSSNIDMEDLSNNSLNNNKEKNYSGTKRGKSNYYRHSRKKIINN